MFRDVRNYSFPETPSSSLEPSDHPGRFMASAHALRSAYDEGIVQIERGRGGEPACSEYRDRVRDSLFEATWSAWAASSAAVVAEAHPKSPWGCSRANGPPDIQVVSAAPGSWKTTYAKAFAIALARATEDKDLPLGCAFLVHHVDTADAFYHELEAHLPGRVAVWTGEHDVEATSARKVRFTVDDLERAPVIIVTHEFFKGIRGNKARSFRKNGITLPRALTFVDEKVSDVEVYDVTPSDINTVREFIQADDHNLPLMLDAVNCLLTVHKPEGFRPRPGTAR